MPRHAELRHFFSYFAAFIDAHADYADAAAMLTPPLFRRFDCFDIFAAPPLMLMPMPLRFFLLIAFADAALLIRRHFLLIFFFAFLIDVADYAERRRDDAFAASLSCRMPPFTIRIFSLPAFADFS